MIIKDRFLDEAGTGPAWTTAFAVHILVNTQQGGCYKTADAIQWMTEAGFTSATELEKTAVVQGLKGQGKRMMDWLKDPGFLGTHATIGADLSQLMATLFTGLFYRDGFRRKNVRPMPIIG